MKILLEQPLLFALVCITRPALTFFLVVPLILIKAAYATYPSAMLKKKKKGSQHDHRGCEKTENELCLVRHLTGHFQCLL